MVTAPKCKVCGSAHYGVKHVWAEVMKEADTPRAIVVTAKEAVRIALPPPSLEAVQAAVDRFVPKRDRAAYMRGYRAAHPKVR